MKALSDTTSRILACSSLFKKNLVSFYATFETIIYVIFLEKALDESQRHFLEELQPFL